MLTKSIEILLGFMCPTLDGIDQKRSPDRVQIYSSTPVTSAFSPVAARQLGMSRYEPLCNRSRYGLCKMPYANKGTEKPVVSKTRCLEKYVPWAFSS